MKTNANLLDLSALPPAARREVRDFYLFLVSRSKKTVEPPIDAAQEHDRWFRGQIEAAIKTADDPTTEFIPHETVRSRWAEKKKALHARVAAEQKS